MPSAVLCDSSKETGGAPLQCTKCAEAEAASEHVLSTRQVRCTKDTLLSLV